MTDSINWCDLKKNAKHIGEVSTSKKDGSPTGVEILTSTNEVTGQERDTLAGKFKKMDDAFSSITSSQFIVTNFGNWSTVAGQQIVTGDEMKGYEYPDDSGDVYAVKGSVTLPITRPSSPEGDDRFYLSSAVNVEKMRSEAASQLSLVYQSEWSSGITIPAKAMTDRLAYWHNGKFYSVGTDASFISTGFDSDLSAGKFIDASLVTNLEMREYVDSSSLNVRLTKIADIDLSTTADNAIKIENAMKLCVANNWKLVVDCIAYVDGTRILQQTAEFTLMGAIHVPDGLRCEFLAGASINALPNNQDSARVLVFKDRQNIRMYYPKVVGDRQSHTGTTGEWGHGYELGGAIGDIYLHEPKALNCWGDGFYIGPYYSDSSTKIPDSITLYQPFTDSCSRNGISWTGGTNINIIRPVNKRVNRIAPMCGIDIEPEHTTINDMPLQGVIESPISEDCGSYGLFTFLNKGKIDVDIIGTVYDDGSVSAWVHKVYLPAEDLRGSLNIQRIHSKNATGKAYNIENLQDYVSVNVDVLDVDNCWSESTGDNPAGVFETSFGARGRGGVDAVFADVRIGELNIRDTRPLAQRVGYPLLTSRKHAQVTYMNNVDVSVGVNQTKYKFINTSYGIDTTCNFECVATFKGDLPNNVLASHIIFKELSTNTNCVLRHEVLTNGAGCIVDKRSLGSVSLVVKPPQDGTKMYADGNEVTQLSSSWVGARLEIMSIDNFKYSVAANYGFS
ncbi:MAG: hypothetical protein ACPGUE_11205 [Marinomonas sp.]